MKIAIVNVVGVEGSTGKIATKLAEKYNRQGDECRIYHGRGKCQTSHLYRKYGSLMDNVCHYLKAKVSHCEGEYSTFYTNRLISDMFEFAPDVVILLNLHGHYLNIPLFMERVAKTRMRVIYFMCDEFPYTARCEYTADNCVEYESGCNHCPYKYKNLQKQYCKKEHYYDEMADRIVFASVRYIVERASRSSLLNGRKLAVVNTGIDTEYYQPVDTSALRKKMAIGRDKVVLINVAPFSNKRKGVEFFLDAAKILANDEQYIFINIGYDNKREIDLPKNFIGIPYVEEQQVLREYYSIADAYICTSIADALPNACVSAMSCGTPIIGFPVSGIPYIAEEPVLHILDAISVDAIVKYLQAMKKKSPELSDKCRKYAVENYSFTTFAEKLYAIALEL